MRYFSVLQNHILKTNYWVQYPNKVTRRLYFSESYKEDLTFWAFSDKNEAKNVFERYVKDIESSNGIMPFNVKQTIYNEQDFLLFLAEQKLKL